MKIKTTPLSRHSRAITAILCAGSLMINSCTTQSTAYQVQTQPMNQDLEKKVLQETGLSGMAVGAVVGGLATGAAVALLTKVAGGNEEQVKRAAIAGFAAGAVGGGVKGYQEGQKKGQQMVGSVMTRDQARQLVKGAKSHNQQLASYNSRLKEKIASVKQFSDPKEKKLAYSTLKKQTDKMIKDADKKIETRNTALKSDKWAKGTGSEMSQYRGLTNDMVSERNALETYSTQLSKLEQSVVY